MCDVSVHPLPFLYMTGVSNQLLYILFILFLSKRWSDILFLWGWWWWWLADWYLNFFLWLRILLPYECWCKTEQTSIVKTENMSYSLFQAPFKTGHSHLVSSWPIRFTQLGFCLIEAETEKHHSRGRWHGRAGSSADSVAEAEGAVGTTEFVPPTVQVETFSI